MRPQVENRKQSSSFFKFENMAFPVHLHSHAELVIVRQGKLALEIQDKPVLMQAGEAALIYPNMLHGYQEAGEANGGMLLLFSPDVFPSHVTEFDGTVPGTLSFKLEDVHPDATWISATMFDMLPILGHGDRLFLAYANLLLALLIPASKPYKQERKQVDDALYQAVSYIARHYGSPIGLESLAHAIGYSEYYLSHLFNAKLKMGFRAYLNSVRIGKAQEKLRSSDRSVTEILYDCGFENMRTFHRAFHRQCGMTPSAYRNG